MTKLIYILAMIASVSSYDTSKMNREQAYCLAHAIYHEARGETLIGQAAVAHVVLNRVKSKKYPDEICKVVYQPRQFSHIKQTKPNYESQAWKDAVEIGALSMLGAIHDPTGKATHYYAHKKVEPYWKDSFQLVQVIGNHSFLR